MSKFLYQSVLCNFSPITVWLVIFWRKNIEAKRFLQNVGEIDYRDQFYQHTRSAFFMANKMRSFSLANSTWQTALGKQHLANNTWQTALGKQRTVMENFH